MDILKKHALGNRTANHDLFKQVGSATQYQEHLKTGISHIQGKKIEQGINSLFSRGGTQLDAFNTTSEFEVISYLILVGNDGK